MREWSVGGQLRPVFQKISIWQDSIKKVLQMRVITVIIISLPSHTEFTVITKCRTVCYVITLSHCITDHIYFVIR